MKRALLVPWLLVLTGCPNYAKLCADGDPSVDPATCFHHGRVKGWNDGRSDAYPAAYDEGYAACAADTAGGE